MSKMYDIELQVTYVCGQDVRVIDTLRDPENPVTEDMMKSLRELLAEDKDGWAGFDAVGGIEVSIPVRNIVSIKWFKSS